ncbi:MAG TPA: class I SAM-dependent RNA methyltransferase [Candidatus Binataceae bacterium]|nr:class I SAM-dependent RNA methyltransferase [Candidatus Binataceae bacterium]
MPEIEVTGMSFGPYAVAHLDGRTLMVPHAARGDRLEVAIISKRGDTSFAKIERVIEGGPDRREPPCRFLPQCGGCDWQHLNYPAQLRAKTELVATGLRRVNIDVVAENLVAPAPEEFGYRSRIRLKVGRNGKLGFHRFGSNDLVEIDRCLVAAPSLRLPNALTAAFARNLDEVEIVASGEREVIVAMMRKPPSAAEVDRARRILADDASVQGIILKSGRTREVISDPTISINVEDGLDLEADADLFSQVNHAQNRKLVATVMEMASIERGARVLDIFCGAGNLSLPAARRGAIVNGIDADELAIAAATKNAERLSFGDGKFIAGKALDAVQFLIRAKYRPDIAILDPPRTGAADLMEPIAKLRPRAVVYVSCDIATLARDLRVLSENGYRASRIAAFDFFPNTHHIEIAAHLLLT